jgi:hypothetical protein
MLMHYFSKIYSRAAAAAAANLYGVITTELE